MKLTPGSKCALCGKILIESDAIDTFADERGSIRACHNTCFIDKYEN